jgi:hypothetical protein
MSSQNKASKERYLSEYEKECEATFDQHSI